MVDTDWVPYIRRFEDLYGGFNRLHLAIFIEPYLKYILEGKKTVESRFSMNRCAPFGNIEKGDLILLKRSGGPIVGVSRASYVWNYSIDTKSFKEIQDKFSQMICPADEGFWGERKNKMYATLIQLERVEQIVPLRFPKQDRRGWVVLSEGGKWKM